MKTLRACFISIGFVVTIMPVVLAAPLKSASGPAQAGASAAGASFLPRFSADGKHVVYVSAGKNLVSNDDLAPWLDVFARDLVASNTVLVSVNTNGVGGGNADANFPVISSNGQFIAFVSRASNLASNDGNNADDVFIRDLGQGTTRLVSLAPNGATPADPFPALNVPLSGNPLISANGRWVFFESRATNLTAAPDSNGSVDVFGRDTWSNLTVLVSANQSGTAAARGTSALWAISGDGRYALFSSTATDVLAGINTNSLYLRDVTAGQTVWAATNYPAFASPVLSDSGDVIAFIANAVQGQFWPIGSLLRVNHRLGTTETITAGALATFGIHMNADGDVIGFTSDANPGARAALWRSSSGIQYFNYDDLVVAVSGDGRSVLLRTDAFHNAQFVLTNTLISHVVTVATNGGAPGATHEFASAAVNFDGSLVVFDSEADNLVADDRNAASDVFSRDIQSSTTALISTAHPARVPSVGTSMSKLGPSSISADGRWIVYSRYDDGSTVGDTNHFSDVFVTDVQSGNTKCISLAALAPESEGGPSGLGTNFIVSTNQFAAPAISADGSTVIALQKMSPSFGGPSQLMISFGTNGAFPSIMRTAARDNSVNFSFSGISGGSLSGDGRLVAFSSPSPVTTADNDGNNTFDVYVRYYFATNGFLFGTNFLVSRGTSWSTGNAASSNAVLSLDGRWIRFLSGASNLVRVASLRTNALYPPLADWGYGAVQLIVGDLGPDRNATNYLETIPLRLASYTVFTNRDSAGYPDSSMNFTTLRPLASAASNAVQSANNRYICFDLIDRSAIFRHDLLGTRTNWFYERFDSNGVPSYHLTNSIEPGAENVLVCSNCWNPSVSSDGNVVVYEAVRSGSSATNILAMDLRTGVETLISVSTSGGAPQVSSKQATISPDARYVVFESKAADLVAIDTNGFSDIFVRDRILGSTLLVSANAQGRTGSGPSASPVLSANGRSVVFQSFANDLVPGDYNDRRDIFVLTIGAADSDGDGLDDDWEIAYFGNLSRNGAGDFDGDGISDRDEFLAGTDPTNGASVFRVMTVAQVGGGAKRLIWSGSPTRTYRVEFKDDLNTNAWTPLPASVSWNGSTATATDDAAVTNRFYRVVRMP